MIDADALTDYLSKADIEVIDQSIKENAYLPYGDLREKSHGKEWERAFYNTPSGRKVMDVIGMAKDGMASDDMVEYIKENLEIEAVLS